MEQMPPQFSGAPEWPKPAPWLIEPRQRLLRSVEFLQSGGPVEFPQRRRVRPGMIADPVAEFAGAPDQRGPFRRGCFAAKHKEAGRHAVTGKAIEHARRDFRLRTVIE